MLARSLFLLASTCLGALGGSADPFASFWQSTWRDIYHPRALPVNGTIPSWVSGSLLRNAGGAYETGKRNVTSAFDGFPKIYKFNISEGHVNYQERFLNTEYYQYVKQHDDIPKIPLMTPVEPPFSPLKLPQPTKGDTTNIQVWRLKGSDHILALTDSSLFQSFDLYTLDTYGALPQKDETKEGLVQLSASHPQYDPNAEPESTMINFANVVVGWGTLVGHHEITVFRMGADGVRHPFGSAIVDYAPYIHSFAVTKTKMVLVVYPMGFEPKCVMEFKPLVGCMQCPEDRKATILVFDLKSTKKATRPVATIEANHHFVLHHINGYDEEESGDVVFTVSAWDFCDKLFHGPTATHAVLAVMRDPATRDNTNPWAKLRTFRIGFQGHLSFFDTVLRDAQGYVYNIDFPVINNEYAARRNRFIWGSTAYARNSTHYADWCVVKVDREAGEVNTKTWYKKDHFPSEPIFVPRPGGAEDDGVVLVSVNDGVQKRGYLLILNGTTMEEIATASLEPGEHIPYTQHGRFFSSNADSDVTLSV